jgi:hypothetical protein
VKEKKIMVSISKYAEYDFDEGHWNFGEDEGVFDDFADEITQQYRSLGDVDWRERVAFLDNIGSLYPGIQAEIWISEKEDEIIEEMKTKIGYILESFTRDIAKEMGGEEYSDLYYDAINDYVWLGDIAAEVAHRAWVERSGERISIRNLAREELNKAIQENQDKILLTAQQDIKDTVEGDVLTDTVRFMETPEETMRTETITDPSKLENIPSEQGLGSASSRKNNRVKRGGKMLIELFKLAHTLDKKGEYELASEVDEIIKELSQRAGLTTEEMVSLANDLDAEGETDLADKLDTVLAKKKSNP